MSILNFSSAQAMIVVSYSYWLATVFYSTKLFNPTIVSVPVRVWGV